MRWLKFNAVGLAGIGVQLGVLALLMRAGGLGYLIATPLAVEAAIVHNFFWHWRWTWADRVRDGADRVRGGADRLLGGADRLLGELDSLPGGADVLDNNLDLPAHATPARRRPIPALSPLGCFLRFQLSTGLVSLAGNVLLTALLTSAAGLDPLLANSTAIVICSLLNYLASDRFSFALR